MKAFFLLLGVLGSVGLARAELVFEQTEQKITASATDETRDFEFTFTNKGSKAVTINQVQTSCGCLFAASDKPTYAPGEKGVVSATIKLGTFEGDISKSLFVLSNDKGNERRQLVMKVTIPKVLEITPEITTWALGEEPAAKKVTIKILGSQPFDVLSVVSQRENFTAELKEIEKGRHYEVAITPRLTNAPTLAALKVQTSSESKRHQSKLIFANIVRPRPGAAATPAASSPAVEAPPVAATPAKPQ